MEIKLDRIGDVTIIAPQSEYLDASNSKEFKEKTATVLQNDKKVVLNLERVQFVDSTGCSAILTCLKQLTPGGGDLCICCVSAPVAALFHMVRLERIVSLYPSQEEAVKSFAAG